MLESLVGMKSGGRVDRSHSNMSVKKQSLIGNQRELGSAVGVKWTGERKQMR